MCELDNHFDVITRENLTGGIPRIDDDNSARLTMRLRLVDRSLQFLRVQSPACVFVQKVSDLVHVEFSKCRAVEWILWDWDHHAGSFPIYALV